MKQKFDVGFVILNYKTYQDTIKCVQSIVNTIDTDNYFIVIVDNGSDNESLEEMLSFAKRVKEFVPELMLTVVDIIGEEEIKKSQAVADSVGIHLRVREYVD